MRIRPMVILCEDQLIAVLRGVREATPGLTQPEADFRAGFPDGYIAKLEAPHRRYGRKAAQFLWASLTPWLEVLGLRLVLMDAEQARALVAEAEGDAVAESAHRPYPDRGRAGAVESRRVVRFGLSVAA